MPTPETIAAETHELPDGSTATVTVTGPRSYLLDRILPDGRRVWGQAFSTGPDVDRDAEIAEHLESMAAEVAADPGAYCRWWFAIGAPTSDQGEAAPVAPVTPHVTAAGTCSECGKGGRHLQHAPEDWTGDEVAHCTYCDVRLYEGPEA